MCSLPDCAWEEPDNDVAKHCFCWGKKRATLLSLALILILQGATLRSLFDANTVPLVVATHEREGARDASTALRCAG